MRDVGRIFVSIALILAVAGAALVGDGVVLAAKPVPTITITPSTAQVDVPFEVKGKGFKKNRPTWVRVFGVGGDSHLVPSDKKGAFATTFTISTPGDFIVFVCQWTPHGTTCGPAGDRLGQTDLTVNP